MKELVKEYESSGSDTVKKSIVKVKLRDQQQRPDDSEVLQMINLPDVLSQSDISIASLDQVFF